MHRALNVTIPSLLLVILTSVINLTDTSSVYAVANAQNVPEFKFPWAASDNPWYYLGGPHGWGGVNICAEYDVTKVSGIDVGRGAGRPVLAMASGTVLEAGFRGGWGFFVELSHGEYRTLYAHLEVDPKENPGVRVGDTVPQGTIIGFVGCTGTCYGAHLHVDLKRGWQAATWDGVAIEGWRFRSARPAENLAVGLNYRGTATRGSEAYVSQQTCDRPAALVVGSEGTKYSSAVWARNNDLHSTNAPYCPSGEVAHLNAQGLLVDCTGPAPTVTATPIPTATPVPTPTPTATPLRPPPAPQLLHPPDGSLHPSHFNLRFEWNAAAGAQEYLLEWWSEVASPQQPCRWIRSTQCQIGQVTPERTYFWRVKARNHVGESVWSQVWRFTVNPTLEVSPALEISPSMALSGQEVVAHFTIRNLSEQPIILQQLTAGARGPECADLTCPRIADFPHLHNITLQPGQAYAYSQSRTFDEADNNYFARVAYRDSDGAWHFAGSQVPFTVREAGTHIGRIRGYFPVMGALSTDSGNGLSGLDPSICAARC